MQEALAEARRAAEIGEVPIGAVIVRDGEIVGRGHNRREIDHDPLARAEILAIRQVAGRKEGWRLTGCTMYVTLEPCAMCAGALVNSRIERLVWGAPDPKAGWCGTLGNLVQDPRLNHRLEMTWTAVPAVVLVAIAFAQMNPFAKIKFAGSTKGQPVFAEIWASQFDWRYRYPGLDGRYGTSDDIETAWELVVPKDEKLVFNLRSRDVLPTRSLGSFWDRPPAEDERRD